MTYREILKQYREGKLDAEQQNEVAAEIEKHEAISDYLCDEAEIPALEDLASDAELPAEKSEDFALMMQKSIRRAFCKAGVIVGAVTACAVLGVVFGLPKLVDKCYYNPAEMIDSYDNRLSFDLSVYTELFCPTSYRESAGVICNGNADYDITIYQDMSYTGKFENTAGKIHKNKMTLYNPNLLQYPSVPKFNCEALSIEDHVRGFRNVVKNGEEAAARIAEMDEDASYNAYVTFDRIFTYDELTKWMDAHDDIPVQWCGLCVPNTDGGKMDYKKLHCGFRTGCIRCFEYENARYPYLTWFSMRKEQDPLSNTMPPESAMHDHVVSMLQYLVDSKDFMEMMGGFPGWENDGQSYVQSVQQNDLLIYGFVGTGTKEELSGLLSCEDVGYIWTEQCQ